MQLRVSLCLPWGGQPVQGAEAGHGQEVGLQPGEGELGASTAVTRRANEEKARREHIRGLMRKRKEETQVSFLLLLKPLLHSDCTF